MAPGFVIQEGYDMRFNRFYTLMVIVLLIVLMLPVGVFAKAMSLPGASIRETQLRAWTGAAWTTVTQGWMRTPTFLAATVTGATTLNGGLTMDTNKFTVADTSGNVLTAGTLTVAGDVAVNTNKFTITAASGNTLIAGTASITGDVAVNTNKFNITAASGNTTIAGTLQVSGAVQNMVFATVIDSTASRVITSADYGKIIFFNNAGAVAVTLPANGAPAGSWFDCINIGADSCIPTYSAATVDTLITVNDQQADSVTYATGNRIGSHIRFISTGTYWVAVNVGSTTMAVTT